MMHLPLKFVFYLTSSADHDEIMSFFLWHFIGVIHCSPKCLFRGYQKNGTIQYLKMKLQSLRLSVF